MPRMSRILPVLLSAAVLAGSARAADLTLLPLADHPALTSPAAQGAMLLAVAHAGNRLVTVGERGVVLLSDDNGTSFRQARQVPSQATLTAAVFIDAANGWAVGHWGSILHTIDGGESWTAQRGDIRNDRPLFSVYFRNAQTGWAVGLWSELLRTDDGGAHWQEIALPPPPGANKADLNLFSLFSDTKGDLFATAEQGKVLRSADNGDSWVYLDTGYSGSLWAGLALHDGTLLAGGLRGNILRSTDGGQNWRVAETGTKSSITGLAELDDGSVVASALDGVSLISRDGGASFTTRQRDDRLALTAATQAGSQVLMLSKSGPQLIER